MSDRVIILISLVACLMALEMPASAQLAVADAPVLGAVGALGGTLQSILQRVEAQLAQLSTLQEVLTQLQHLAILAGEVDALVTEIQTLNSGWDQLSTHGSLLCTVQEAVSWKGQALQWQRRAHGVARTAQSLLARTTTIVRIFGHMLTSIIGSTSAGQASVAVLATIAGELQVLQSMTATANTMHIGQDAMETVLQIQVVCIQQSHFRGWGSYSR